MQREVDDTRRGLSGPTDPRGLEGHADEQMVVLVH